MVLFPPVLLPTEIVVGLEAEAAMEDCEGTYFEYIVVGCGGIGSAAAYWLSKRANGGVLGLEQFRLGHDNGGSQDHSRIIRCTYHDDCYTRLAPHTFTAWEQIEKESGLKVLFKTGSLTLGIKGQTDDVVEKYAQAMDRNNIKYERLNHVEINRRYPQLTPGPEVMALSQDEAGLVDAALGNSVHVQLARGNGATILENAAVTRVGRAKTGEVMVTTTKGVFRCRRLVVTAGAWINHVLGSIGVHVPITVTQEQVTYFSSPNMKDFTKDRMPVWIFVAPQYDFYSLPIHGNSGTKIGIDAGGPHVTADTRTFTPDPVREQVCVDFLKSFSPKMLGPIMYTKTCLYDMPPDRNFVIDSCAHKGFPDVIACCGAGHAFKFAGLLGKILSELAIDGCTQHDISSFSITRDVIVNPPAKSCFQMGTTQAAQPAAKY